MSLFDKILGRGADVDPQVWQQQIDANHRWWQTEGAVSSDNPFSCYDRDEILEENGYSPDVIIRINRHIITMDSQSGKLDSSPAVPHPDYVKQFEERDGVKPGLLEGCRCTEDQRPYLSAIGPKEILDLFRQDFPDIAVFINGPSGRYTNATFNRLKSGGGVNVTKSDFLNSDGELFYTVYPTNIWSHRYNWTREVRDIPPRDLQGLGMITFIGTEYRDDNGAILKKVLKMLEGPDLSDIKLPGV